LRSARPRKNPYGPGTYAPPLPPAGSYDPALDAARRAASRGLLDTQQDTGRDLGRAGVDYSLGVEDANNQFSTTRSDYDRNKMLLQHSFQVLAGQQQQSANAAGLIDGGALLQSAAKRKWNQDTQQQALDTDLNRARQARDTQIGRLGLGYTRQTSDLATGGQRALREDTQFGLDTEAQKAFQATQANWDPPLPRNQLAFQAYRQRAAAGAAGSLRRARRRR